MRFILQWYKRILLEHVQREGKILFLNNIHRIYSVYLTDVSFVRFFHEKAGNDVIKWGYGKYVGPAFHINFTSAISSALVPL